MWSPTIPKGEADILVALEWAEGLRWLPYLKQGTGIFVCDTKRIVPPFACLNRRPGAPLRYSRDTPAQVREHVAEGYAIDATEFAQALGNERTANVVLLGALSSALDFPIERMGGGARRVRAEEDDPGEPRGPAPRPRLDRRGGGHDGAVADSRGPETGTAPQAPAPVAPARAGAAEAFAPYDVRLEITPQWCKSCDICVKLCPRALPRG